MGFDGGVPIFKDEGWLLLLTPVLGVITITAEEVLIVEEEMEEDKSTFRNEEVGVVIDVWLTFGIFEGDDDGDGVRTEFKNNSLDEERKRGTERESVFPLLLKFGITEVDSDDNGEDESGSVSFGWWCKSVYGEGSIKNEEEMLW